MMQYASALVSNEFNRRQNYISGVYFFAFMNGVSEIVYRSIHSNGLAGAIGGTFGLSVIVYVCFFLIIQSIMVECDDRLTSLDIKVLAGVVCLALVPNPYLSWIGITLLAFYERRTSEIGSARRRSANLMFGMTVPMFWGKIVFALLGSWILRGDALLVSLIARSASVGNVVTLPQAAGYLWIAPACSSFANVSLAVLCWVMFTEYSGRLRSADDYVACFFACVNVVLVNVARIGMIALRPDLFEVVHGPIGATIASWLTAIVILATLYFGVKRDAVPRDHPDRSVHFSSAVDSAQSRAL